MLPGKDSVWRTPQPPVGRITQEANRKHDLSLVEYLVKEVFFYVGLEHLRMSIQLRRHPTIQARCMTLK